MAELPRPESAVVRFRDGSGAVVGAGFLVSAELVVTCAHVVAMALGQDEQVQPSGPVTLEFPVRGPRGSAPHTATVVGWTPTRPDDRGDIAVLRLDGAVPEGVRPAHLSTAQAPAGTVIDALGFPDGLAEQGRWARGLIRQEQATGWLQIDSMPGEPRISPGYSGTPVFSARAGGVIGIVVAVVRDGEQTTTFLNPARMLVAAHPLLAEAQASPYRGLAPFGEQDAAYFGGRDQLISDALGKAATHPMVVLSGPSGSGKSSLARAGLLPALREQGRTAVTMRVLPDEPPAQLLARIRSQLSDAPDGSVAGGAPAGYVVLVDQFEEAAPIAARDIAGHLHRLTQAAGSRHDGRPRLVVILTLRGRQLDTVATGETAAAMQAGLVLVAPMTAAQLRAAVKAPGAVFEDFLVQRLVTDAGTEPGTLPLLEFTLDRLWERRRMGVLTHAAYDELGGVAGAVARRAGRAVAPDPVRARRLLLLLARPDDDGVFRRRPMPVADLPAGLRPALDRLVEDRLVVVGAGDEPVVELAHESLIRAWPELGEWLEQDRAFRTWLEELRRSTRRWEAAGKEPAALLRGAALATAERWAESRAPDLTAGELAYVRVSVAQDQRRARRGRGVTAGLVVLTLLAGLFALVARQQSTEVGEQLRLAASRQLAADSDHFRSSEPSKALQLALAAWHTEQTPEAYGALFTQYAAMQPVDAILTGVTATPDQPISMISTSQDGSVSAIEGQDGAGAAWRGLGGGEPQRITFGPAPRKYPGGTFRISSSGRWYAYANDLGGVYLRDVTHPELPPVELALSGPDDNEGPTTVQMMRFAPDENWLAVLRTDYSGQAAEVRVWDLRTRRQVPEVPGGGSGQLAVHFGPVPGSLVLSDYAAVTSYDLASGRVLRTFQAVDGGQPIVAGGGSLVVSCGIGDEVVVRDLATGRQLRKVTVPSCAGFDADSNSEFGVLPGNAWRPEETNASLVVVDPRAGTAHRVALPPAEMISGFEPFATVAGFHGPDGPAVLVADGIQLYRVSLGPAVTLHRADGLGLNLGRDTVATPDGRHRVLIDTKTGRLTVVEAGTDREVSTVVARRPPRRAGFQGAYRGFTDDSSRLLLAHHDELVVYRMPELTVDHRLALPVRSGLGGPPGTDALGDDWAASIQPVGDDQAIVLYAGTLSRWDVRTGVRLGEPVPLRAGEEPGRQRRVAQLGFVSGRRPGHPEQVAVVLPGATVEVWDLGLRRAIATFGVDAARTLNTTLFHPDGTRLAVKERAGSVSVWRMDDQRHRPRAIPVGAGADLLGFTPGQDSQLATVESSRSAQLRLWDLDSAQQVALLTAPIGSSYTLIRDEIGVFADGYARHLRLDPQLWFRSLCALSDRPYTADEITLLQSRHVSLSRPCP